MDLRLVTPRPAQPSLFDRLCFVVGNAGLIALFTCGSWLPQLFEKTP